MNFNDILDTKLSDIEKPPLPPFGLYKVIVQKHDKREMTAKDGTEYEILEFFVRGLEAGENVDQEALRAYGPVKNIFTKRTFMFNKSDDTAFATTLAQVRNFLEKHLKIPGAEGMALKEALAKSKNAACWADIQYRQDKNDAENMFLDVKGTAPIE